MNSSLNHHSQCFCYMQPTAIPAATQSLCGQMANKLETFSEFMAKIKDCFPLEFYSFVYV